MRFQPRVGRYLAAAAENVVSILDVETQACRHSLQVSGVFFHLCEWNQDAQKVKVIFNCILSLFVNVGANWIQSCVFTNIFYLL
jgi:hypothetical protein